MAMKPSESLIDDYLALKEMDRKIRPPNIIYITDICKACQRNAYFSATIEKPPPIELLYIFETGRILESWYINSVLRNSENLIVLGTQLPARYIGDGYEIHGRIDALCQHEYQRLVIHEVKTAKTSSWLSEPKKEHWEQLQWYLNTLGIDWGQIDMIDKTILLHGYDPKAQGEIRPVDKSFTIQRDPTIYPELITRGRLLNEAINMRIPPEKTECWACGYCEFVEDCKSFDGVEPINEVQEEVI